MLLHSVCRLLQAAVKKSDWDMELKLPGAEAGELLLDGGDRRHQRLLALPGGRLEADLFLENMHCAACVWLIEKLPAVVETIMVLAQTEERRRHHHHLEPPAFSIWRFFIPLA